MASTDLTESVHHVMKKVTLFLILSQLVFTAYKDELTNDKEVA